MKKLRVTVNQKVYEVLVEVLEDDEQYVPGANMTGSLPPPPVLPGRKPAAGAAPAPAAPAPAAPTPAAAAPAGAPPAAAGPAGGTLPTGVNRNAILAPIAGTVQKVFVESGMPVEEKTPVILLDAMKMDTYIYAPRSGLVAEVCVKPGDAVQVGALLIRFQPEA